VSTRLPLKILRNIDHEYRMIDFIIQRLKLVENIDEIYLCTSHELVDDILEDVAAYNGIKVYRGSPSAVIERMIAVGDLEAADNVIRITGDNVFTSVEYLEEQIKIHNANSLDYTRIVDVPIGATAEVMSLSAVKRCYDLIDPAISEYLLLYMFKPDHYKCGVIRLNGLAKCSNYSVTVDTQEDLSRTKSIVTTYKEDILNISLKEIMSIIKTKGLPNSTFVEDGMVKMPYGKEILFSEFQEDMSNRINDSHQFIIG